jgi:hypothetical protein
MNQTELKIEALRAANQAVSTQVSSGGYAGLSSLAPPKTVPASAVLEEAKRIYAWLTDREAA